MRERSRKRCDGGLGPPFLFVRQQCDPDSNRRGEIEAGKEQRKRAFPEEGPSEVARLAGFEPTTPWFVAKYSIQLSYSRTQSGTTSTDRAFGAEGP